MLKKIVDICNFLVVNHVDSINCFSRTYSANLSISIAESRRYIGLQLGELGVFPGARVIF
jgi:hypothetical protein